MDARQAILERRTAHLWKSPDEGGAVPDVVVKRALEAAHSAPCHKFTWPWGFVWAGPETRAEIFDLGVSLKCPNKAPSPRVLEKLTAKMKNPAHLVAVTQTLVEDPFTSREDYAACARASQNMALSIHADGFASKWSSGGLTCHTETYRLLGVSQSTHTLIGFVWIGVPQATPAKPDRSPLNTHIRRTL